MKVVVDDKIPYIQGKIERLVDEVVYLPEASISADDVKDADILLVRTRTHCCRELLEGSRVRLVVTATIGFDHLDTQYLDEAGIEWHNCPGCNATSVAQYVRNSLLALQEDKGLCLSDITLGIVGVGHVGSEVLKACRPLVKRVLLNDPPRQEAGQTSMPVGEAESEQLNFSSLDELREQCDVITIHTPLIRDGKHPTFHLVDESFLHTASGRLVLINSGRGEVVDNQALLSALEEGRICEAIVDTWENEPRLSRELLKKVYIGTPHIAGYSADGKANATRMSLQHIAQWLNDGGDETALTTMSGISVEPPSLPAGVVTATDESERALQLYDPRQDSSRLKADPSKFEYLRGHYPLRRERI